jgi:hypothetical protein
MSFPNWDQMMWYHYLGIGAGVVVILALLLYFVPVSRLKVPAIIMGIVGGLGAGVAIGAVTVMVMMALGVQMDLKYAKDGDESPPAAGGGRSGPRGGGGRGGMGGGGRGGMGGGGGAGARGASSKPQLVLLIAKLDVLTGKKPLSVTLDAEQKEKVRDTLKKLLEEKELSEDEAKARLDGLEKILTDDQRKTLANAGYQRPAQGGGGRGAGAGSTPPNPFSEGENHDHLTSLRDQIK